jgi:hypothetical protein
MRAHTRGGCEHVQLLPKISAANLPRLGVEVSQLLIEDSRSDAHAQMREIPDRC